MEVNDEGNQYCFTTNDKNRYIKLSKNRISNPEDAAEIMRSFIGNSDREHLILICMNSKNEPTHIQTLSIGSINQTVIHPREIFKTAILSNANSIMLGHNHPSGDVLTIV